MVFGKKIFNSDLLSLQVKEYLVKQIAEGKYESSGRLPPEDVMAEELGVSRLTLRSALASLEKEGVLLRRRGIGTLINRRVLGLKARIDYEVDFSLMLRNYGYEVEVRTLSIDQKVVDVALC
ncbi:MAG TPA: GntR family transcriptional regulator, partial [Clostridia bacterium]|nr:GntR family transcriptional regulator [Clostridia bacterium]